MIKRTIALGTAASAAVIVLFATGPEVATHQAQVWSQAANAQELMPIAIPLRQRERNSK